MLRYFLACCGAACLVASTVPNTAQAIDILYYGNSFTNATCCGASRSVPSLVSDIAVAAGQPAPNYFNAAVDGQSISWHLANNTAPISSGIGAGEEWEFVVLQDFSTNPTHIGNLPLHLSSTLAMYQQVAAHSADVTAVMYETWARGPGHSFYTGGSTAFPGGPTQMQAELRDGYHMSTENIIDNGGAALYAPAGDAWENGGFPLNFYSGDIYHANNRGTLLNALVLYGTIYDDPTTSDIDLSGVLGSLGLSAADGMLLTSIADATMVPEPSSVAMVLLSSGAALVWYRRRM